jgi:hypothetical protein
VYLFRRRTQPAGTAADSDGAGSDGAERTPPFATLTEGGPGAGSAAEWALGEILIRLCNGGRGLRSEPREHAPE